MGLVQIQAQTPNPCGCCPECPPAGLACRRRAGICSLCGFDDLVPTDPPNKWLNRRVTGDMSVCQFSESTCAPSPCPGTVEFSGIFNGIGYVYSYSGKLEPVGPASGGFIPYKATLTAQYISGFEADDYRIALLSNGVDWKLHESGMVKLVSETIDPVDTGSFQGFLFLAGNFVTAENHCITISYLPAYKDSWDLLQTYSALTCLLSQVDASYRKLLANSPDCPPSAGALVPGEPSSLSYPRTDIVKTSSHETITGDDVCVLVVTPLGDDYYEKTTGLVTVDLNNPDTEENAIERFRAANPWGDSPYVPAGGSCPLPLCCLAQYQDRGDGLTFAFADAEFQVTKVGLAANTAYPVKVTFFRRAFATGDFHEWKTVTYSATTDNSGNLKFEDDVPNEKGFETFAHNACVLIPVYKLTTTSEGSGSLIPDAGVFRSGYVVTINALPAPGWEFTSWSGDLGGTANPQTLTMDADKHVIAIFSMI